MSAPRYVLITPARDEERHIRLTLESVIRQDVRPLRWIIVSDNSTDSTPEIVSEYAAAHPFIELVRLTEQENRTFASKVWAFRAGYERLGGLEYDFIGNLDGDMSFDSDFYARLLGRFADRPHLGIASGIYVEDLGEGRRYVSSPDYTPGALQLFRRECFEQIGGYRPMRTGGIDTLAETMARMHGWEVEAFADLRANHHKPGMLGGASSKLRTKFREGMRDHNLGMHPLFLSAKCARRVTERPWLLGSFARLAGYARSSIAGVPSDVPADVRQYFRSRQIAKARAFIGLAERNGSTRSANSVAAEEHRS